jgi:hypothetical protein
MRFLADDIWKVRAGEKTRLTIPYDRKPSPFKEAGFYVLERDVEVVTRKQCRVCDGSRRAQGRAAVQALLGAGERVYYTTRTERVPTEEQVHVLSVTKVRAEDISDDQALEEGWESAEEWRDAFFCDYGECEWVWTYTFELTAQVPQYLAVQNGQEHPEQYVKHPGRALDDADAPTGEEYRQWAEQADDQRKRRREIERLEERKRSIDDRLDHLRRREAA